MVAVHVRGDDVTDRLGGISRRIWAASAYTAEGAARDGRIDSFVDLFEVEQGRQAPFRLRPCFGSARSSMDAPTQAAPSVRARNPPGV